MKTIYKSLIAAALSAPLLTGCIEDPIASSIITADQLQGSPKGVEALVWGMPGHLNVITLSPDNHFDFGYASMLHIRDVMTEDMYVRDAGGYNWFAPWSSNSITLGMEYLVCQYPWNFYYEQILTTNSVLSVVPENPENPELRLYRAAGLSYRAFVYLDIARQYEFLPTEFNAGLSDEGNDILGLTVPIVTETTTEEQMRNNPRVGHDDMVAFIKKDLDEAIALYDGAATVAEKTIPTLAVAYGLMARLYLWDASYQDEIKADAAAANTAFKEAERYARLAIETSKATPLTREEWLDTTKGFNDASFSSWLFAGQYVTEDDVVQAGGIRTWASFMSPESTYGYCSPAQGAFPEIGASLYKAIDDRDFRKLSFTAPEGSQLGEQIPFINNEFAQQNFDGPYISVKFRPGNGNMEDYTVGTATAYPLMRVEEMYFIEAEAAAHQDAGRGKQKLLDFMRSYRFSTYSTRANTPEDVVKEIILQKRIELWGEGITFFDIKRLDYDVTRFYPGTNFEKGLDTFNTNGRPAWMNFVIVRQESDNNKAIVGYNSPSPAGLYDAIR